MVLLNCLVFSFTVDERLELRQDAALAHGFIPSLLLHGERMGSLFTHMFLHADASHLLFNMVALLLLGIALESRIGGGRLLLVYLVCGVLAALIFGALDPTSTIPVVGASAAIFGLMGNLALLYPTSFIFIFIFPVPVMLVAVLYAFVTISIIQSGYVGPVGHVAHLAGMAFGMGLAFLMNPQDALKGFGIFVACFAAIVVMMWLF